MVRTDTRPRALESCTHYACGLGQGIDEARVAARTEHMEINESVDDFLGCSLLWGHFQNRVP